ncbi:MAG: hypothetical protein GKS06_10195 [Acidobacteria bacterium]|nr:hypothetical protein [Acidobacteriota bacterium]
MPKLGELHPGRVELVRYVHGTLGGSRAAAVFAHCALCPWCTARLEHMLRASPQPVPAGWPDEES